MSVAKRFQTIPLSDSDVALFDAAVREADRLAGYQLPRLSNKEIERLRQFVNAAPKPSQRSMRITL